jgi:hypothetical protein
MLNTDHGGPNQTAGLHTSVVLLALIGEASPDEFTLAWLIGNLPHRSFGAIMLLLAIISMVPVGISIPAGLLIAVLAVQIILGYPTPIFPRRLMTRPLPSRYLRLLEQYVIPPLKQFETVVRPRWPTVVRGMLRVTGVVVLLLTSILLTFPLPLSNIPVAASIALIALAHTEQDGLLLSIALAAALILFALAFVAGLGLVDGVEWIFRRLR